MARFIVSGVLDGNLSSLEVEAVNETEAAKIVIDMHDGFLVEEVQQIPAYGSPNHGGFNVDSSKKFVNHCDWLINLIRILGWITGAIFAFIVFFQFYVEAKKGHDELFFGAIFATLIAIGTFIIVEAHVFFIRFMRENISLLREIRENLKN